MCYSNSFLFVSTVSHYLKSIKNVIGISLTVAEVSMLLTYLCKADAMFAILENALVDFDLFCFTSQDIAHQTLIYQVLLNLYHVSATLCDLD